MQARVQAMNYSSMSNRIIQTINNLSLDGDTAYYMHRVTCIISYESKFLPADFCQLCFGGRIIAQLCLK